LLGGRRIGTLEKILIFFRPKLTLISSKPSFSDRGPMLWFKKIFLPKNLAKILAFFAQTTANICKNCDHNTGLWEKPHFFFENWRKLQKIVIITSTPAGKLREQICLRNKMFFCRLWIGESLSLQRRYSGYLLNSRFGDAKDSAPS
jgi:hypothetical protein